MGIFDLPFRRTRGDNNKAILVGLALVCCALSLLTIYLFLGKPLSQSRRGFGSATAVVISPAPSRLPALPIQNKTKIVSRMRSSPGGSYFVIETHLGDYNTIVVKDRSSSVIVGDLVARNAAEIGMNRKFACQCGVSFEGWSNPTNFVINISNALGEEFEFIVDAQTGLVNERTFKRVR
jgi:hypothetical protein